MTSIHASSLAVGYGKRPVVDNISLDMQPGELLVLIGTNGSGKSTLLKCLSGAIPLTSGAIRYHTGSTQIAEEQWFRSLALATPYLELPEEFTLSEVLAFHFQFKNPLQNRTNTEILEVLGLEKHKSKAISQFSSGMKQRVKLALAIFSEVPLLLLDEPTTNLDTQGLSWYLKLIQQYSPGRILVICSNDPREYDFCEKKIN